jgi:hypothetical protein
MSMSISRESFNSADSETKLLLIFDMLLEQNKLLAESSEQQKLLCERRCSSCDQRFIKLERRRLFHTTLATLGGILGGFVAILIKINFVDK